MTIITAHFQPKNMNLGQPNIAHMSFRLVPNLVTLNDLERRNVKVVEDKPILSAVEM